MKDYNLDQELQQERSGAHALTAAEAKAMKRKQDWELVKTLFIAFLVALVFRSFIYEPFHIPSGSMKKTLLVGDYLFVSKSAYGYSRFSLPLGIDFFDGRVFADEPKRGDVVVFRPPAYQNTDYIKRLVGMPGDRIQVTNSELYINGEKIPRERMEDFIDVSPTGSRRFIPRYRETLPNGVTYDTLDIRTNGDLDNTQEYVVPEGHYFMMGDNRDSSTDSRVLGKVGYIPFENLIGRAEVIMLSTNGKARFWEFWNWPGAIRTERLFTSVE